MAMEQIADAGGGGLMIFSGAAQLGSAAMTVGSARLAWLKVEVLLERLLNYPHLTP